MKLNTSTYETTEVAVHTNTTPRHRGGHLVLIVVTTLPYRKDFSNYVDARLREILNVE